MTLCKWALPHSMAYSAVPQFCIFQMGGRGAPGVLLQESCPARPPLDPYPKAHFKSLALIKTWIGVITTQHGVQTVEGVGTPSTQLQGSMCPGPKLYMRSLSCQMALGLPPTAWQHGCLLEQQG